ncbi:DUF1203 domain-containing protein (plasmid) [Pseudomonas sp. JZ134]
MAEADIVEGRQLLFMNTGVDYLHIHFARRGCYADQVDKV